MNSKHLSTCTHNMAHAKSLIHKKSKFVLIKKFYETVGTSFQQANTDTEMTTATVYIYLIE